MYTVLVVVDWYTKPARYYPVNSGITALQLADTTSRKLVLRGAGFPSSIVTDRGTQFPSRFMTALCYHLLIIACCQPHTVRKPTGRQSDRTEPWSSTYTPMSIFAKTTGYTSCLRQSSATTTSSIPL
jgi:hypothetical protein